jgi:hypothetical protein
MRNPSHQNKRGDSIRPIYLLLITVVAVIFFTTLFIDSIEIKLSNKFLKPSSEQKKPVKDNDVTAASNNDVTAASNNDVTVASNKLASQDLINKYNKQKKAVKDNDLTAASNKVASKDLADKLPALAPKESVPADIFHPKQADSEATPDKVVEPEPALAPEVASAPSPDVPVNTITEPAPEEPSIPLPVISSATGEPGLMRHPAQLSDTYLPRGKPSDDATKKALAQTWGEWTFVDPKADKRPKGNFYADYPNRDVPRNEFPANAWQTDKEYLSSFLPQAKALVERSMEAILSEYGHGKLDEPDKTFDERSNMFSYKMVDLQGGENPPKSLGISGWTTERSFDGLARRILHAVVTEDKFTLVMSGHSSAAGHGNHLQQSYTLQFQKAMEPIFARLGVKCLARNMGMGGMGTIQNSLAAGDLYGKDVDILLWDSGMTEKGDIHLDVFARQGLMGGDRVPMLLSGSKSVLTNMHNLADADVGAVAGWGGAFSGIPKSVNLTQVETIPWATRYIDCVGAFNGECRAQSCKYESRGPLM